MTVMAIGDSDDLVIIPWARVGEQGGWGEGEEGEKGEVGVMAFKSPYSQPFSLALVVLGL